MFLALKGQNHRGVLLLKSVFESTTTKEVLDRMAQLQSDSQPLWGKMNAAQMLAHCSAFQEIAVGNLHEPRSWLGLFIGRFAKPVFYNDKPLPQNMSTMSSIMITNARELEREREILKQKLLTLQKDGLQKCHAQIHPFFGKLTAEEWGKGIYKHLDHHLKQFGV